MAALRWLAVLPAAIFAFVFTNLLFGVLSLLLAIPETANTYITQAINSIFPPYYFVYIGARVAPAGRFYVAIVLTVISAMLAGAIVAMAVLLPAFGRTIPMNAPLWWLVVTVVLGLGAGVFALVRVQKEEREPPVPGKWYAPALRVLSNIFGIVYGYGYFGQFILYLYIGTGGFSSGWGWLRLLLAPVVFFQMLFTWYFWVLVAVSAIGFYGASWLEGAYNRAIADQSAPQTFAGHQQDQPNQDALSDTESEGY